MLPILIRLAMLQEINPQEWHMSHKKQHSLAHDVLIAVILIFLASILVNRVKKYVHLNKHSVIHQIDEDIADTITKTLRHLGIVKQTVSMLGITDSHSKLARTVRSLSNQLHDLEQKYTHNAPSLALLGPLGTASIVLKEEELKEKLHYIALGINDACVELLGKTPLGRGERKTISLHELITTNSAYTKELRHSGHTHHQ
jgi:hypothetical protein